MSQRKLDKVIALESYVRRMQATLFAFEVTMDDGPLLAVMSDLLTTIDHAKNDMHWIKKDIREQMINSKEEAQ